MPILRTLLLVATVMLGSCQAASLPPAAASGREPEATAVEAALRLRGELTYAAFCSTCHGSNAQGGKTVSLTGTLFQQDWSGSGLAELAEYIAREMPPRRTHISISHADADAVARLLNELNGGMFWVASP